MCCDCWGVTSLSTWSNEYIVGAEHLFLDIQRLMVMMSVCSNGYITTHSTCTASLNYSIGTEDITHHHVIV